MKELPSRMLKRSIDPNCNARRATTSLSLALFFPPRLLVVSSATLLFDSTRSLGLAFSSLGCFSHSEEKGTITILSSNFPYSAYISNV